MRDLADQLGDLGEYKMLFILVFAAAIALILLITYKIDNMPKATKKRRTNEEKNQDIEEYNEIEQEKIQEIKKDAEDLFMQAEQTNSSTEPNNPFGEDEVEEDSDPFGASAPTVAKVEEEKDEFEDLIKEDLEEDPYENSLYEDNDEQVEIVNEPETDLNNEPELEEEQNELLNPIQENNDEDDEFENLIDLNGEKEETVENKSVLDEEDDIDIYAYDKSLYENNSDEDEEDDIYSDENLLDEEPLVEEKAETVAEVYEDNNEDDYSWGNDAEDEKPEFESIDKSQFETEETESDFTFGNDEDVADVIEVEPATVKSATKRTATPSKKTTTKKTTTKSATKSTTAKKTTRKKSE